MRAFILVCFYVFSSLASAETYTVATFPWEPFLNEKRKGGGVSIELIRTVMENENHKIKVHKMSWDEAVMALEEGSVDILPAVWFTEERTNSMVYSDAYAVNRLVFIKNKNDSFEFEDLSSLHDKKVGVIKEYAYDEALLADDKITFVMSDSLNENLNKLVNGEIDLTLEDQIVTMVAANPKILNKTAFVNKPLVEKPLYITCNKSQASCAGMIESFNRGLAKVKAEGTFDHYFDAVSINN